ncbi:MAG TPA: T9SS type A sorting domain-containing protein [Brumimicrobium sp.]|nr:T9SS type A sorting domain-containing protein [Brumimicrobium sp.]
MKKTILFTALLLTGSQLLNAQAVTETVSIGAGYTNETWYSLETGDQNSRIAADWDLSFDLTGIGTSIRTNSGNGILLYTYPNGAVSDWSTVDTTGITSWNEMYNADTSWRIGALDQNINPNDPFDVGWGTYNMITHVISGDSIFIIKLMDGSYRKLRIDNMASGVFNFTFANIDGTNEIQASVAKTDYADRLFGYYSLQNETELNHEPIALEDWDLFFGKYTGFIPTPYSLTGIIAGPNTQVAKISGVTDVLNYNDWSAAQLTTEINTIGADWKEFDMGTYTYTIAEDRVYFVKTHVGDIWKIVPTGFGGSSNGNFEFTKEKLSTLSLDEDVLGQAQVIVYPNPASENVSMIFNNMAAQSATAQITNLKGQVVAEYHLSGNSNFEVKNIPVHEFEAGVYIVNVKSGNQQFNQKLIIK